MTSALFQVALEAGEPVLVFGEPLLFEALSQASGGAVTQTPLDWRSASDWSATRLRASVVPFLASERWVIHLPAVVSETMAALLKELLRGGPFIVAPGKEHFVQPGRVVGMTDAVLPSQALQQLFPVWLHADAAVRSSTSVSK